MSKWKSVFSYELSRNFRRKAYLFATFGIPLIAALIVGGYLGVTRAMDDTPQVEESSSLEYYQPIGYVDQTANDFFARPAEDNPLVEVVKYYPDFETGQQALNKEQIAGLYVIPGDYFAEGKVVLWLRDFDMQTINSSLMEAFLLQHLSQNTDIDVVLRLRNPITTIDEKRIVRGDAAVETNALEKKFLIVYAFALALMISTFTASGYLMQSVVEEKESKTVEIILTSVKPFPLLFGKILAMGLLGLFQILAWGGTAILLLQLVSLEIFNLGEIEVKPVALIITLFYFVLGFLFTGSLFAAVGALVNSTRDGSQIAGWLVFPTLIPMFFIGNLAEAPNGTFATVLSLIPFTAPMTMVMRVAITDVPLYQILISTITIILTALVGIWIAGRAFQAGILLRGTPFSFREIPQLFKRF